MSTLQKRLYIGKFFLRVRLLDLTADESGGGLYSGNVDVLVRAEGPESAVQTLLAQIDTFRDESTLVSLLSTDDGGNDPPIVLSSLEAYLESAVEIDTRTSESTVLNLGLSRGNTSSKDVSAWPETYDCFIPLLNRKSTRKVVYPKRRSDKPAPYKRLRYNSLDVSIPIAWVTYYQKHGVEGLRRRLRTITSAEMLALNKQASYATKRIRDRYYPSEHGTIDNAGVAQRIYSCMSLEDQGTLQALSGILQVLRSELLIKLAGGG